MNKREAQENIIKTILTQKLTLECLTLMVGGAVVSGTSAPAGMGDWEFAQVGFALISAAAPRSISPFSALHNSAAPLSLLPPSHPASSQALLSLYPHMVRAQYVRHWLPRAQMCVLHPQGLTHLWMVGRRRRRRSKKRARRSRPIADSPLHQLRGQNILKMEAVEEGKQRGGCRGGVAG